MSCSWKLSLRKSTSSVPRRSPRPASSKEASDVWTPCRQWRRWARLSPPGPLWGCLWGQQEGAREPQWPEQLQHSHVWDSRFSEEPKLPRSERPLPSLSMLSGNRLKGANRKLFLPLTGGTSANWRMSHNSFHWNFFFSPLEDRPKDTF